MINLLVSIEKNGIFLPVGNITGRDTSDACFQYSDEYLSQTALPISISLPLQETPFSAQQTACFFEGLLPEGFTRRTVAQWMHLDEDDYLSILHALGRECLGALRVSDGEEELTEGYTKVNEDQIRALAAEGALKSSEFIAKSHLSLTGASGKVGLYYDASQNTWYLPRGSAPSTHIVKQSHIRLDAIVTNEKLSLMTAALCGLDVPDSFVINTGSGDEHEVLFATQRYDRIFDASLPIIDGLKRPSRLHQEDFAQAMGIPSASKYEKENDHYLKDMFDLLRKHSADPISDQLKLWDMIVFNYLIGNTDAHIKNFSLLYGKDLRQIRLAPSYDIISTVIYEQSTRDMAFRIGTDRTLHKITRDSFKAAASDAGIQEKMALQRFDLMSERFPSALHKAADTLSALGFPKAAELENRILRADR